MKIEIQEEKPKIYNVAFDIQPLADEMGISKQKCAELLADELMAIIFGSPKIKVY